MKKKDKKTILNTIKNFMADIGADNIEVYNEFSLQYELGIALRDALPKYKVQFERDVKDFFPKDFTDWIKWEIDICILSQDEKKLLCAIELKYPRNGQYPEQMFQFCREVCFTEQLKKAGFEDALLLVLVDDHLFYKGNDNEGIYKFFRNGKQLHGNIFPPTGPKTKKKPLRIKGYYPIVWSKVKDIDEKNEMMYLLLTENFK